MTTRRTRPHPGARDLSLDAFRGLTVLLMILVNLQVGGHAFAWIEHAEWNGLTLADLVFPWFLLIVGLSIPLAIDGRQVAVTKIVRRSVLLFAIGLILAFLIRPRLDIDYVRWPGVLQRIAVVYLACALLATATRGWRAPAIAALLCLVVHIALLLTPAPHTSLAPGEGLAGWLDRLVLPGRLYKTTWDPEGVLSTLSAIGSGLIGIAAMRWLRDARAGNARLGMLAVALAVFGFAATLLVPINKALWTASFALVTAGLGLALWLALRLALPRAAATPPARLLVLAGQTALTLYIVHSLLIAVLVRTLPDGRTIWVTVYDAFVAAGLTPQSASLLFAVLASAVSLAVMPALKRRGWVLKL